MVATEMAKQGPKDRANKSSTVTNTEAKPSALVHNPFAALAGKREELPEQKQVEPPPAPTASEPRAAKSRGRLVLRRETKHRGGKPVIIVRGFSALKDFDAAATEQLAKELKKKLGCGGTVEHDEGETQVVLQGDQPAKVAELLRARGFRVDGVTS